MYLIIIRTKHGITHRVTGQLVKILARCTEVLTGVRLVVLGDFPSLGLHHRRCPVLSLSSMTLSNSWKPLVSIFSTSWRRPSSISVCLTLCQCWSSQLGCCESVIVPWPAGDLTSMHRDPGGLPSGGLDLAGPAQPVTPGPSSPPPLLVSQVVISCPKTEAFFGWIFLLPGLTVFWDLHGVVEVPGSSLHLVLMSWPPKLTLGALGGG